MMEEKLPKGWEFQKIGDLSEQVNGKAFKPSDWSKKGTPIIRIQNLNNFKADFNYSEDFIDEKFHVNNGDLLFAWSGTPGTSFGAHIWNRGKAYLNQHIFKIKIKNDQLDQSYYYYALKITVEKFIVQAQGTAGLAHITKKKFENTGIPVPPIPDQQRIVAKLDALFGHLDSLREKLDGIPVLLKNFRQQVLTQAVTGELTKDWREGKNLPEEDFIDLEDLEMREIKYEIPKFWQWLPFISVAEVKSNLVQPNEYLEFPLIAPDNIEAGTGRLLNKPLVSEILPKSPKHYFSKGDIVYSKIRPYLSKLVLADFDGLCSADMYPISTTLNIKYLYYYMLSDVFLRYATTAGERSVLPKINQKELAIIPISIPSKKEQQEIVKRIEALFSLADKIESQYISLKAKIDQLPQVILAKAFRGELVEQEVKEYVVEESEGLMAAEPDPNNL